MTILFLDFDDVLRREDSPRGKLDRDLVERFERFLRKFPELEVVIASSWKDAHSLDKLRSFFSEDLRLRIVGKTPSDARPGDGHARHREAIAWLSSKGLAGARWIAVDDDPENYPPGLAVLVDAASGFDEEAERALAQLIQRKPA